MRYSELELRKMNKAGIDTREDEIKYNILAFIHTIYLNKQNFIEESYDSKYFGDLEMTFKKKSGQVIGIINVNIKSEGRKLMYIFSDQGYELLDDLL